jgi:hypothetical protein
MQYLSFERLQTNFEIIVPVRNQGSRGTEHEIWRDSKNTGEAWTSRTILVSKSHASRIQQLHPPLEDPS